MEQASYNSYAITFDTFNEPRSLMRGHHQMGAMSGKEAYERVVTGLEFLIREFEMQEAAARWRRGGR